MDDQESLINDLRTERTGDNEKLSRSLMASCVAALATFGFGYNMGYASPAQKFIQYDKDTNPDGILSVEDFSWFNVGLI